MNPVRGASAEGGGLYASTTKAFPGGYLFDFDAVQPTGARTCCAVSRKESASHAWLDSEVAEFAEEYNGLLQGNLEPRLSRREHLDALGVFTSLRRQAAQGKLRVGPDRTFRARTLSNRGPYLIELRPKLSAGTPPPRLFRLYYAEPAVIDGALLPLVLRTKPTGGDPDKEQDAAIDDANARSRSWALYRAMKERTR